MSDTMVQTGTDSLGNPMWVPVTASNPMPVNASVTATLGAATVTPAAGAATAVATANTAVTIVGANAKGGFITNLNSNTASLIVNPVGAALTVPGGANIELKPGQTFTAIPGSTLPVTGNASVSSLVFEVVQW